MPNHASRSGTVRACEASLKRLGTDHLDCYLLHWPGPHPLEETIAAFEQLVQEGKIRSWGLSNFDVDDLEEALEIAGPRRIACNQVLYHLRARDIEDRVLPWCVGARRGRGRATAPSAPATSRSRSHEEARCSARSPGPTARPRIRWRSPSSSGTLTCSPSPSRRRLERVRENAAAAGLRLSPEEVARIEEAFPLRRGRGLPTI